MGKKGEKGEDKYVTPVKPKRQSNWLSSIKKTNQPSKRQAVVAISKENIEKFEQLTAGRVFYPRYLPTQIEQNLRVTYGFFGPKYKNVVNHYEVAPCLVQRVEELEVKKIHFNRYLGEKKEAVLVVGSPMKLKLKA